jgi:murein DD-endopeptidase MepM/ murein hydrolase activator NlpD
MAKRELKRDARTFGIGAACGFIAGAMLAGVLLWKYGNAGRAPAIPSAHSMSATGSSDGLADVDSPVIEGSTPVERPAPTSGTEPAAKGDASMTPAPPPELASRELEVPVEGIRRDQLTRSFEDRRSGTRVHEAIDILAPRNTPVKAVEDGTIARLFLSKAGGITIYQFDPSGKFCYYYAHLERYADDLAEGAHVRKGQVLGYVGTSGNAPKDTPHLHFAVFRLTADKHWWEGTPIDPYDILR